MVGGVVGGVGVVIPTLRSAGKGGWCPPTPPPALRGELSFFWLRVQGSGFGFRASVGLGF